MGILLVKYRCDKCGFRSASPDIKFNCTNCYSTGRTIMMSPRLEIELMAEAVIKDFKLTHGVDVVDEYDLDEIEAFYGSVKANAVAEYLTNELIN